MCEYQEGVLRPVAEVVFDETGIHLLGDASVCDALRQGIPDGMGGTLTPEAGEAFLQALPMAFPGPYRVASQVEDL